MSALDFTLLTDGSSDQCLLPLLTWLVENNHHDKVANGKWADLSVLRPVPKGLVERIRSAVDLYPSDVLFVHRDAEGEARETRVEEIRCAAEAARHDRCVCVVPVRMTEAWLLMDEAALRRAAGNPNGKVALTLPNASILEKLLDPKDTLYDLLKTASGRKGRRLEQFKVNHAVHLVLDYMSDFSTLRQLSSFRALEDDIKKIDI